MNDFRSANKKAAKSNSSSQALAQQQQQQQQHSDQQARIHQDVSDKFFVSILLDSLIKNCLLLLFF